MKLSIGIKLQVAEQFALDVSADYEDESLWESLAQLLVTAARKVGERFLKGRAAATCKKLM